MPKRNIKHLINLLVLLFFTLFLVVIVVAHFKAESMVADFLKRKLPDHVQLNYDQIDVNVLGGNIELKDATIALFDRDSTIAHTKAAIDEIALKGLGYWQFFAKKKINVNELYLQRPKVSHYLYRVHSKKDKERQGVVRLLKTIAIEELKVVDGQLDLFQEEKDSIAFQAKDINFNLVDARTGPEQIKEKIPITYGHYRLSTDNLFVDLGRYEQLRVGGVLLNDGDVTIEELDLRSKFTKAALSKSINTERDHISLKIPKTILDDIEVGFKNDTLHVTTGLGKIMAPTAEIYRDKLVTDDLTRKRLYSRMLRELPIRIDIPKVEINGGRLVYSERVETALAPGKISFDDLNAVLSNISNGSKADQKAAISAEAKLMNHAPIKFDWTFDVSDKNDVFTASGVIKNFKTKRINAFLESNLRAKSKGTINRMYFTVSGDANSSSGDMKMKYEDFEFSVLKKNRLGVNKLLTAIGRIFINDGSNADAEGFRYGTIDVERDPTKSFFNYLWLNVRDGTVNTLVGKSEKVK